MSTSPAITYEDPIIAPNGNQVISVESSISFQWMPAAGNSYVGYQQLLDYTDEGMTWDISNPIGPSTASGDVTFTGVASSEPFQADPTSISFAFTDGWSISLPSWDLGNVYDPGWTYDPTTGTLDPQGTFFSGDDWIGVGFSATETDLGTEHWSGSTSDQETGHWQLLPQIHNVDVFGGVGNDTILGGQGTENLFGGVGNDVIRAGIGDDLVRGGTGNDQLYGGIGQQTIMGGTGDDTIWGGSGAQLLIGGNGQDMIHAGSGQQTLMGGTGNATLWGGAGDQVLEGGHGSNVLNAGAGNETLSGGTGKNTFVFATPDGNDIITNFRRGHDIIEITFGSAGPTLTHLSDLLADMSADAHGDAVLSVGGNLHLALEHVLLSQVQAHAAAFFKLG